MNIIEAAHSTVHQYPHGGSLTLSLRMGMSSTVLNSKVNPNCDTHHLRLDEALTLMEFTKDDAIIQAMAYRLGGVYCKVDAAASESNLLMTALFSSACQGEVMASFSEALADGTIDSKEFIKIQASIQSAMSVLAGLSAKLTDHCANK